MNKKNLILLGVILVLGVASFYLISRRDDTAPVACTMEAKLCADGSAVGRTGPNCEFAECPSLTPSPIPSTSSGIRGMVLIGPTCPVEMYPPDPKCADRPYQTRLAVTTVDGERVIKEFSSDASGKFSVAVSPGQYAIRSAAAANVLPYCASDTIRVIAGKYTEAAVSCDSGIR